MFAYKDVLHAGKYDTKPITRHCNMKDKKNKVTTIIKRTMQIKYTYSRIRKFYKGT